MHHIQARSQPPVSRVMKPAAPRRTASFPADRFTKTQLHQPLPAMSRHHPATIPPPLIHKPWAARAGQPWRKTVASLVAASLATPMAVVTASLAGVAVGSLTPPAQAHASRCVTVKGTDLVTLAGSRLGSFVHCLRIEDNDNLNTIDLAGLSGLRHLSIVNNTILETINLTEMTSLTHLRIDNNYSLTKINLPRQSNLLHLHIINNPSLKEKDDIDLSNLISLKCLIFENNENLITIDLPKLTSLTCLKIDNNK